MEIYKKASAQMIDEIINIISVCFEDPIFLVKFFFEEKRFLIDNFYVCAIENKIVSVVYALDSKIKIKDQILNGIYIYAVCTLEKYRSRGYISNLLKYVHKVYLKKGYDCVFLSPSNLSLASFYEKLGYKNFFKTMKIKFTEKDIIKLCETNLDGVSNSNLTLDEIESLRNNFYKNDSLVLYNKSDIEFAVKLYKKFNGGEMVSVKSGYGICRFVSSKKLEIIDLTCEDSSMVELIKKIHFNFPGQKEYIIKTSPNNNFFKNLGSISFEGMILPLTPSCESLVNRFLNKRYVSYLGISLE